MKTTTKKILALALVCSIPLGVFAYDKYEKHDKKHDRDDCKKSSHHHSKYNQMDSYYDLDDDDIELTYELVDKKGVNLAFEGLVELKPENKLNGVWTISGKEVLVDDSTIILMEKSIDIKQEVAVLAKREEGKIKAILIEED